jgi:ADP-ribose pyrophosphatase
VKVNILNKKQVYSGFFSVTQYKLKHELFAGGESEEIVRECFERGPASGVLAYDPIADKVVLIEQFRIGVKANGESGWVNEIIAGIIDDNQTPEQVAIRESQEEAGCTLIEMEPICQYYTSPGGTSEILHLYCAAVDSKDISGIYGLKEEGEDIRAFTLDYSEAVLWLNKGKLNNASSIICMQWLILNRDRLINKWKNIY